MSILSACNLAGCHASTSSASALFRSIYSDYSQGNLNVARARAEQARKEFAAARSENAPAWELKFRLLEAEVLLTQGHHASEALAVLRGEGIPTQGDSAIKWHVLCGWAHAILGHKEEAEHALRIARQLAQPTHSSLIADILRTEGLAARQFGEVEQADQKFKSSLGLGENGDPLIKANNLVDLGFDSLGNEHYAEALDWSQRATELARSIQARRPLEMALGNAGWAYQSLGDFDRALAHFQDADREAQQLGITAHRVVWLQDAGLAEYRLGNLEKAADYDEQALRLALTLPTRQEIDQIVNIETNLARLLYEQGQYETAKRFSDAAAIAVRDSEDKTVIAYARLLQGLIASHLNTDKAAEDILMSAWQLGPDLDVRADIENAIANLYSGRQQLEPAQLWYRRAIQTFEDRRSSVNDVALRLSAFSYGEAVYRDYADFLIRTNKPTDALHLLDRSRSRTLEEGLGFAGAKSQGEETASSDPRAIARKLHGSILFYSLGRKQSYLWVVTADKTQLFMLPSEKEIQSLVEKHQTDIQQSNDVLRNPNAAGVSLYETLIKPEAEMIAPGSRVAIIPDGVLHGLNFETLVVPGAEGNRYWIEDVTVTTASSIRMLGALKENATGTGAKDLLLIGDPIPPGRDFAALPDAAAEIQRVSQHFPVGSQVVISKEDAIPAAYVSSSPDRYRYIHFAAHGTASRLSPLDSAIVLSPPRQQPEDFKLYARDIVQHPLNATLVTISACYGSGIRTYAGEGLVGLAWVFLRAGSHNVIAALWQVADAASPLLMGRLYGELQAGKAPDVALRAAKLSLIHSNGIYRKPLFWGAFQLYAGS